MSEANIDNIMHKDLVMQLRRESINLQPKVPQTIIEENEDEVIHVTHNFSQIIKHWLSLIKRPFGTEATRKRHSKIRLCLQNFVMHWKTIIVVLVPLILLPLLVVGGTKEARCAFVMLMMVFYWMTEVLPLPVTSLLPIALFPPLGVLSTDEVCASYFKEVNMMLFGGLSMATAIEHCNLHERIALKVLLKIGTSPRAIQACGAPSIRQLNCHIVGPLGRGLIYKGRLMLGFMIITMFLSMWISNTAATAMTAPILTAVLKEIQQDSDDDAPNNQAPDTGRNTDIQISPQDNEGGENADEEDDVKTGIPTDEQEDKINNEVNKDIQVMIKDMPRKSIINVSSEKLTTGYFLSLSFSSNIGGTGTLIGTGTNLILAGIYESLFPKATPINFAAWMALTVPSMLINTFLGWVWLQIYFLKLFRGGINTGGPEAAKKVGILVQKKYDSLGKMTFHEHSVLTVFVILVVFWLSRSPQFVTGWGDVISDKSVRDSTPAIFFLLLLFMLPANKDFASCKGNHMISPALLTWATIHKKIPWGLLLLMGGGFAMATGCSESGLSKWIGEQLAVLNNLPPLLLVFVVCILACSLTQVTSNTSSANIFLPVLGEMSKSINKHPLYLMIPTTLACSYAFMLPVGTPPNAIVQAAANMNTIYMMKAGAVMSIISVIVSVFVFVLIGGQMFDFDNFEG